MTEATRLHNEILPEQDCGGELIELPEDEPTLRARCGHFIWPVKL
jgi:hypothetical protein